MKTKFTPGPWEANDGDGDYFGIFDANGAPLAYLVDFDGHNVHLNVTPVPGQEVAGYSLGSEAIGWQVNWHQHKANARLIAAAPELYESVNPDELLRDLALADTLQQLGEKHWDNGLCILARELRERTAKRQAAYDKATPPN